MKVIFMGTPDFAVGTLEALHEAGHEITLVVSQPDKPKGRGHALQPTPVKAAAEHLGLPVFQPAKVREAADMLEQTPADVIVVAAFGQLIPSRILHMKKFGCVNVHASLLPKYRGAAPIQWAVIDGEKESGVTIMQMDEGLDTGDMIDKVVVPIEKEETGGSLFDKLSIAGAKLCVKVMADLEAGVAGRISQPEESTTPYAKMISKQMGKIDWNRPAKEIEQLVRGLNPWPSAYTSMNGKNLKIWSAEVLEKPEADEAQIGQILRADKNGLLVQTKEGCLNIKELQLEGKKRMDTASFLRGYPVDTGLTLGDK